jgi:hypothetical protein
LGCYKLGNIEEILNLIKTTSEKRDFTIAGRQKNVDTFIRLKFAPSYMEGAAGVLGSLTARDYSSGPEKDEGGFPGDIYVFRKSMNGMELYIKLRLLEEDGAVYMSVVSFHC